VVSGSADLETLATAASGVGAYPITATLGSLAADNYTFTFVDGTLHVTPATLTVRAASFTRTYGPDNPAFTYGIDGFVNGDNSSVVNGFVSLSTEAPAGSNVGSYAITASHGFSAAKYTFTYVDGTLTVTPAVLTVTATSATKVYGQANPAFTAVLSGFVNGDGASVVSGAAALSSAASAASGVGSSAITPTLGTLSAANYTFTFVNGTLTVTPAVLTVTPSNATKVYGQANPTFTATLSGFV